MLLYYNILYTNNHFDCLVWGSQTFTYALHHFLSFGKSLFRQGGFSLIIDKVSIFSNVNIYIHYIVYSLQYTIVNMFLYILISIYQKQIHYSIYIYIYIYIYILIGVPIGVHIYFFVVIYSSFVERFSHKEMLFYY